ncbi:MAG TPA: asparagine synthetase B [Verrucomicrobiae bacterium]|nr:asparagine synthetase B [Verrucomicrobiae bacterium]
MCGIAGIVSRSESDLGTPLKRMLNSMHHRGPDGAGFVIGKVAERRDRLQDLNFNQKPARAALGHVRLAITGVASALQPFQSQDGRLAFLHNGEIYNYRELWSELGEPAGQLPRSDSEVVMRLLERHYQGDLRDAVARILPKLDGVYALAITDGGQTVVVRDRIGVRQLYYARHNGHIAFASERKPLWELYGRDAGTDRIFPGQMLVTDAHQSDIVSFWSADQLRTGPMISDREEALAAYETALRAAVQKRIEGRQRVGIIFSGGIDSVLVAHLVRQAGVPFTCYTVGCGENATDLAWARDVARRLDFPLREAILTPEEVEKLIPEIITDIEDHSLNQVEVAVPIYVANRMAQEAGERVMLTGQGADELFGGYSWYSRVAAAEGYESFVRRSWEDTGLLYKECLEREDKIAMAHSMELRVPFLDPEVVRVAFRIAPELKVQTGEDRLGKRIHREFCRSTGIPEDIAWRVKEAAQHGANVHDTLTELARRRVPDEAALQAAGYDPGQSVTEKLGSSSRYGYRYGDEKLWKPAAQLQFYLDSQAAWLGLLPSATRRHWETVNHQLQTHQPNHRNEN